jgi:hypothetical protein
MVEDTIFVVQYQHILLRNFCLLTNFWLSSKWASVFQCTFSNGTNQRDKGHERISEAVNSDGHDLFFFTSKFKAGTLVLSVHCIVKNIRLCVGLKVHSVVWMVDISLEIFYRHVPTVKSLSYQFNKSSCTIIVLFCKIQAYFLSPNNHTILNFWSRCFRKWCTGDNWRSQTTASLQEEDQPRSNSGDLVVEKVGDFPEVAKEAVHILYLFIPSHWSGEGICHRKHIWCLCWNAISLRGRRRSSRAWEGDTDVIVYLCWLWLGSWAPTFGNEGSW